MLIRALHLWITDNAVFRFGPVIIVPTPKRALQLFPPAIPPEPVFAGLLSLARLMGSGAARMTNRITLGVYLYGSE